MKKIIDIDFNKYENVYVISDIHGHLDEFNKMLDLIQFNENKDLLIVNGDTIDRGYANLEVLRKCLSGKNIKLIMGNHELMMLEGFFGDDDMFSCWVMNGGDKTFEEYNLLNDTEKLKIIKAISNLPYAIIGNLNGIDHIIVHAGIEYINGLTNLEEIRSIMQYQGHNLLWTRERFLKGRKDFEGNIIFGHTPTPMIKEILKDFSDEDRLKQLKEIALIWKNDGKIGIDCGITFGGNLACLRLNDMKEFYV